jgi:hypothetical protein
LADKSRERKRKQFKWWVRSFFKAEILHGRAQTFLVPIHMYGDFMGVVELHMQLLVFIPDKLSCTLVTARLHTCTAHSRTFSSP